MRATRRLLTAKPQRTIADVRITDAVTISDRATVQDACEMFVKHKFFAFPIVDDLNYMRGGAEQIAHLKIRDEVLA